MDKPAGIEEGKGVREGRGKRKGNLPALPGKGKGILYS
jgi:hypothetical protein